MAGLEVGCHKAHQPLEARLDVWSGHFVTADDAQPAIAHITIAGIVGVIRIAPAIEVVLAVGQHDHGLDRIILAPVHPLGEGLARR